MMAAFECPYREWKPFRPTWRESSNTSSRTVSFIRKLRGAAPPGCTRELRNGWKEDEPGPTRDLWSRSLKGAKGKELRYYAGPWTRLTAPQARFAYAWSLAAVEAIEAQSGLGAIDRLLDAERTEPSSEAALRQALHIGFSGLDEATIAYLRQTSLH